MHQNCSTSLHNKRIASETLTNMQLTTTTCQKVGTLRNVCVNFLRLSKRIVRADKKYGDILIHVSNVKRQIKCLTGGLARVDRVRHQGVGPRGGVGPRPRHKGGWLQGVGLRPRYGRVAYEVTGVSRAPDDAPRQTTQHPHHRRGPHRRRTSARASALRTTQGTFNGTRTRPTQPATSSRSTRTRHRRTRHTEPTAVPSPRESAR